MKFNAAISQSPKPKTLCVSKHSENKFIQGSGMEDLGASSWRRTTSQHFGQARGELVFVQDAY